MKRPVGLIVFLALSVTLLPGCLGSGAAPRTSPANESSSPSVRIGTFDRTRVLVAYYGSAHHARELQTLRAERDEAVAVADASLVAEIEARGAASQERAHRQLAGEATLQNLLPHMESVVREIAATKGLTVVVEKPMFRAKTVEVVDITDELIRCFPPKK